MAGLRRTTADLAHLRRQWESFAAQAGQGSPEGVGAEHLPEAGEFGPNPGELRMLSHVPEGLPAGAPLVVALHGCTQTASGYDRGVGWSTLADRYGFALLLPEQRRSNNQNVCFNWFEPGDTRRDRGEAASIRAMIARMIADHRLDASRVFVTGLSAGGAMTSVVLATYPEIFAGGAIIAGLPFGAAANLQQALECMHTGKPRQAHEWGYLVRRASRHKGPWPKVSVWHGSADHTVQPANAGEILKQWTDLHGLPLYPSEAGVRDGHPYRVWRGPGGDALIESYTLDGMAHGAPIGPGLDEGACGVAGPFILDVGISSSYRIAQFWGLTGTPAEAVERKPSPQVAPRSPAQPRASIGMQPANTAGSPQAVIEKALRSAGLLKR